MPPASCNFVDRVDHLNPTFPPSPTPPPYSRLETIHENSDKCPEGRGRIKPRAARGNYYFMHRGVPYVSRRVVRSFGRKERSRAPNTSISRAVIINSERILYARPRVREFQRIVIHYICQPRLRAYPLRCPSIKVQLLGYKS